MRDLTERQQTEARLQELQSELVHVSRLTAMGEMASALAHELNQPLSAIANYLRGSRRLLGQERSADVPRLADALDKAADQALRAGEIIRRLREFVARGETERRVESLSEDDRGGERAGAGRRQGDWACGSPCDFDPARRPVLVDQVQIQQVRDQPDAQRGRRHARRARGASCRVRRRPGDDGFTEVVGFRYRARDQPRRSREQSVRALHDHQDATAWASASRSAAPSSRRTAARIWAENNPGGGAIFRFTLPTVRAEDAADA